MKRISLTPVGAERDSWMAIRDISKIMPEGWCITGGALMRLHLADRQKTAQRTTEDIDVIIDIKTSRSHIKEFEKALKECGFKPAGINASGANHRWNRSTDQATIDLLVPSGTIETVEKWSFGAIGRLIPTRVAHFSLEETEQVTIEIDGQAFEVPCPSIIGALYGKCSALLNSADSKERHLTDIAALADSLTPQERMFLLKTKERTSGFSRRRGEGLTHKQKSRLVMGLYAAADFNKNPQSLR